LDSFPVANCALFSNPSPKANVFEVKKEKKKEKGTRRKTIKERKRFFFFLLLLLSLGCHLQIERYYHRGHTPN